MRMKSTSPHLQSPKLMKRLFLLVTLLLTSTFSIAQYKLMSQPAFKPGEQIRYTVFYNVIGIFVNAGTATFNTALTRLNNTPAYHVVAEGVTNKKYDWIFKVRDRYESYFDTEHYRSLKFYRNINEGSFKHEEEVHFNHDRKTATTGKRTYKLKNHVFDVINAMYFARNIDYDAYKVGDRITIDMFLDNQVYNTYIEYLGKETIKTRYGTFRAIKLRPLLIQGNIFKDADKMYLWVTDDANHIPVRVESPISVGSIKVDLMEYSNLKFPLESLVSR